MQAHDTVSLPARSMGSGAMLIFREAFQMLRSFDSNCPEATFLLIKGRKMARPMLTFERWLRSGPKGMAWISRSNLVVNESISYDFKLRLFRIGPWCRVTDLVVW